MTVRYFGQSRDWSPIPWNRCSSLVCRTVFQFSFNDIVTMVFITYDFTIIPSFMIIIHFLSTFLITISFQDRHKAMLFTLVYFASQTGIPGPNRVEKYMPCTFCFLKIQHEIKQTLLFLPLNPTVIFHEHIVKELWFSNGVSIR